MTILGQFVCNLDTEKSLERSAHWKHKIVPPVEVIILYSVYTRTVYKELEIVKLMQAFVISFWTLIAGM